MKRKDALVAARVAGYHSDSGAFIRAYCENRVSRAAMNEQWHKGIDLRLAGLPCSCSDCADRDRELGVLRLPKYGCVVWINFGAIAGCEAGDFAKDGKNSTQCYEITAPEDQAFLDAVNQRFSTTFELDQFAGR